MRGNRGRRKLYYPRGPLSSVFRSAVSNGGEKRKKKRKNVHTRGTGEEKETRGVSMLSLQFSHLTAGVSVLYDPR